MEGGTRPRPTSWSGHREKLERRAGHGPIRAPRRALGYLSDGAVSSKVEGGLWALETGLAGPTAITWALAAYRGQDPSGPPDLVAFLRRTDGLLTERLGCGAGDWLAGPRAGWRARRRRRVAQG